MDVEVCLFSLSQRTAPFLYMELYKGFSMHSDAYGRIFHACSGYIKIITVKVITYKFLHEEGAMVLLEFAKWKAVGELQGKEAM